jgi:hypothetical protein
MPRASAPTALRRSSSIWMGDAGRAGWRRASSALRFIFLTFLRTVEQGKLRPNLMRYPARACARIHSPCRTSLPMTIRESVGGTARGPDAWQG